MLERWEWTYSLLAEDASNSAEPSRIDDYLFIEQICYFVCYSEQWVKGFLGDRCLASHGTPCFFSAIHNQES